MVHLSLKHLSPNAIFDPSQCLYLSSKEQFGVLAKIVATLLVMLQRGNHDGTAEGDEFISLLRELIAYFERQKKSNILKSLLMKTERQTAIDGYFQRLIAIMGKLKLSSFSTTVWRTWFDMARWSDEWRVRAYVTNVGNRRSMVRDLGFDGTNAVPIVTTLQRYVDCKKGNDREIYFMTSAISHLSLSILEEEVVDLQPWTITAYEVDTGPLIGAGSLGKVFRGWWNSKEVAIKMLKTKHDVSPRSAFVDHEMETWSKLHHPNVLAFLGGNTLDNEPFIVVPFLRHQTSRDYIQKHPDCNRQRLLYETSLGLLYLHSKNIIHGNIKGLNILIGDDEKPQLCDYGFSKIKEDISSRSPIDFSFLASRNWMAPELFSGGNLTFQCDIYSFGMTIYEVRPWLSCYGEHSLLTLPAEILADDIPFGHASPSDLYQLVVENNGRPARPEASEAPQFSNSAWTLAEECWAIIPGQRIKLPTLSEQLATLLSSSPLT